MNICIYRTMRNQWYHGTNDNSSNGTISPSRNHRAVHFLSSRQSSTATEMRRVVGHGGHVNEAAYKKRDAKYTRAAVVMVVAFVVCNTPRFVPNIMEIFIKLDDFPSVSPK